MVTPKKQLKKSTMRQLIFLVLAVIALYAVLPQLGNFRHSIAILKHAQLSWLVLALVATCNTYLAAADVYQYVAKHHLKLGPTILVQLGASFSNRLVPAGIGAIGVNFQYLRRQKHTSSAAAAVVAMNNALGFTGNILLLLVLAVTTSATLGSIRWPHISSFVYLLGAVAVLLVLFVWLAKRASNIRASLLNFASDLAAYRKNPGRLTGGLAASMLLTANYAFALYACAQAVGVQSSFTTTLVIMSIGVVGGTVTPTPGGLGGVEAGLVAGFVLYGADPATALAAVLSYRLFTYWLPLIFGGVAFIAIERKGYI